METLRKKNVDFVFPLVPYYKQREEKVQETVTWILD